MDDCAFSDLTPIDEYSENARSVSSAFKRLLLSPLFDTLLFSSLREKSTGSIFCGKSQFCLFLRKLNSIKLTENIENIQKSCVVLRTNAFS